MDHLFDCTNKLFGAGDGGKSGKLPSGAKQDKNKTAYHCGRKKRESEINTSSPSDGGPTFTEQRRISNTLKILTAVLKFIVDATAMGLISNSQEKCLKFTLKYVEFIMSNLRQHSHDELQSKEEDLKEAFICLKSSFTYAAKLLNLILSSSDEASPPPPQAYILANSLLDLIISIESCLGSGYASRVVAAMKPWLPDLILALGSMQMHKQTSEGRASESSFPSWPSILAKIEFRESSEVGSDEEGERVSEPVEFPAFKKLEEMLVILLRGNTKVLDAVGVIFLTGVIVGLERKDFKLVFRLLHFVSMKLVRHELGEWGELDLMLASLQDIYLQIEREAELSSDENARQMLQSAMMLLEPVWSSYTYDTQKDPMEEE